MLNLIIKAIEANADELQEALNEATGPVSIKSTDEAPGALVIWRGTLSHDAWEIRGIATGEGIPNGTMEFKAERQGPDLLTVEEGLNLLRELI